MTTPQIVRRLGCAQTYTAHIYYWDRVSHQLRHYTEITGLLTIAWERLLCDISTCTITFAPQQGTDCCGKIAPKFDSRGNLVSSGVWPWAHELAIYRDGELVWHGPVFQPDENVLFNENTDFMTLVAKDFLNWTAFRVIHADINFPQLTQVTDIATAIVRDAFAPDDPGVTSHLTVTPGGEQQLYSVRHWEARSFDELRNLGTIGLDFTSIGRAIILKPPTRDPNLRTLTLETNDFQTGVQITIVGGQTATAAVAVGAAPPNATPPPGGNFNNLVPLKFYAGGVDPFFGLVEAFNTTQSTSTDPTLLQTIAATTVANGVPPPRTLSIPDQSALDPDAACSIHDLVPGTYFLIRVAGTCWTVTEYMRLSHVTVTWDASTNTDEQVAVTFIPGATPAGAGAAGKAAA